MGIMDFVKSGVQELMIARPDDKKNLLVYKHPDQTIPMYSQLTVDADEAAVFFRDGSLVGTLRTAGAGQRHTLSGQNIPFLSNLVDSFTGGNIFTTDLFYVTMRPIYNVPFGDQLGFMEDPALGEMVTPRVFGRMAFQVTDPEKLILRYLGIRATTETEQADWVKRTLMASIKTVVGSYGDRNGVSLLQMMGMTQQLKEEFVQGAPELNDIGINILEIADFNLNLNDEEYARLQEAQSEIGAAKRAARVANIAVAQAEAEAKQKQFELDQNFQNDSRYVNNLAGGNYGSFAAGKAMIGAGEGMAKGGGEGGGGGGPLMAGAGLGVGMGMAGMMGQGFNQQQQPPPQQQAAAPQAAAPAGPTTCPQCNANVPGGKFCAECGGSLVVQKRFCPSCGVEGSQSAKFCADCGTGFGG
ncbi:MAG: SPFH domain-containing protein [Deltaproteobacteria bacterium]|nr:SPFH domain-containing protein [Deltaproteobacteria bacterium]